MSDNGCILEQVFYKVKVLEKEPQWKYKQVRVPDGCVVSYAYNNNDWRMSMTTPAGTVNYDYQDLLRIFFVH
jgi:hypothetical protein